MYNIVGPKGQAVAAKHIIGGSVVLLEVAIGAFSIPKGKTGFTFYLNKIQLLVKGEAFKGGRSAADTFGLLDLDLDLTDDEDLGDDDEPVIDAEITEVADEKEDAKDEVVIDAPADDEVEADLDEDDDLAAMLG